jgi:hypothetical protein
MRSLSRPIRLSVLAALAAGSLSSCGEGAAGESPGGDRSADARAPAQGSPCPAAADVGKAVATEVTFRQSIGSSPWITCMYELSGRYRGVFIELGVQPASRAEAAYARIHQLVKGINGQSATPDRVDVGEGGWAFGSGSMSRAAVVSKGRLYQADMSYMGFESIGNQKDAMIRVLEVAIR